jgi:hypothetical protein
MADHKDDEVRKAPDNTKQVLADSKKQEAEEKKRQEAEQKKLDEARVTMHEREVKAAADKFEQEEAVIKAEREAREEKAKEADRIAKLSPEERAAEISPFAATVPHFTTLAEPHHAAEFVLSEANGQRSRGNCYIADPATIYVGTLLKKTAEATATQPATYVVATVGADCHALALYAGGTIPGEGLRISAIVRDAEVNGNVLSWGAITVPEQAIGLATLAANGIIVRV